MNRTRTHRAVASLALAFAVFAPSAIAQDAAPTAVGVPFGGEEPVASVQQPDWWQQPVFNATFTGPSGDFVSTSERTAGVSIAVGGGRLYIASQERGEVTFHDATTRAFIRRVNVAQARAVAYYRGEVYVVGTEGDASVVKVFSANDGSLRRVLTPPGSTVNALIIERLRGIAVAWNEVWLTFVGSVAGGVVVVMDAQTGAAKGVMVQGPRACSGNCLEWAGVSMHSNYMMSPLPRVRTDYGDRWWDIAAVPERNGVLLGCGFLSRDVVLQATRTGAGGSRCASAHARPRYAKATANDEKTWSTVGWMNGTDAVWGMNWYLVTDSSAPDKLGDKSGISVSEYSIEDEEGVDLAPARTWTTRHGKNGEFDIAYQNRDPRIDWSGPLTRSDWLRWTHCLSYVVSDADIYVVGNQGEHWYEQARGFERIELHVDGVQRGSARTTPSGQFCFDTGSVASGRHTVALKAYLADGKVIEASNDSAHFDHTPPTGTLDAVPEATETTLAAGGQLGDAHSGPRTWELQYRQTSNSSGAAVTDGWHPACTASGADPAGRWGCTWDASVRPEGIYQVQAFLADSVTAANGGANTATATALGNTTVAVDRSAPSFSEISGQLRDHRGDTPIYQEDRPPLRVAAVDHVSGVRSIRVLVGEREIAARSQGCPGGGCALTLDATLDPTQFEEGAHTVRVEARDALGHTATDTWQIEIRRSLPDTPDETAADEMDTSADFDVDDGPEGPDTPRDNAGTVGGSNAYAPNCDSDDVVLWSHIDWAPPATPAGALPIDTRVGSSTPSEAMTNFLLASAFLPKIPVTDFQPVLVTDSLAIYAISRDGARRAVIRAVESEPDAWIADYFGGCSSLLSSYPGGIAG